MAGGRRILVHDYSGHPFQVQLSRCLAARGNRVRHIYSESFQTPKGDLTQRCDDPLGLEIAGVSLDDVFRKDSFFKRRAQEVEIGRWVAAQVREFRPQIVLSSNAPLDTQAVIYKATRAIGAKFVFWLQDIYSEAIGRILPRKLPMIGSLVAKRYHKLEYDLLRGSDHIVAITDDFVPILEGNGLSRRRVSVIENWAPLDELSHAGTRHTEAKGRPIRAVYAGTLGYKHNPDILLSAAKALPVEIEVFSEGRVAEELLQSVTTEGITNLHVRPWVSFSVGGLDVGGDLFAAGMYGTPNLSFFFGCDFYMDFGLVGVTAGGIVSALVLRAMIRSGQDGFFGIRVMPFFIGASLPILLRGPVGAVLPLFVCQFLVMKLLAIWLRQSAAQTNAVQAQRG